MNLAAAQTDAALDNGLQDSREALRRLLKLARLSRTRRYRRALRHRVAAAIEHADIPYRSDNRVVIDVGAHHGQFAVFARQRFPQAQLYSFEPLPDARRIFQKVLGDDPNITLFDVALGSAPESEVPIHVSKLDDSSSLLPILPRYTTAFPGTEEVESTMVKVMTLDEALAETSLVGPCLLKIDVQGSELNVLEGGGAVLERVDEIVSECSFVELYEGQALAGDIVARLCGIGFQLSGIFGLKRDQAGRCLQADLFFQRAP